MAAEIRRYGPGDGAVVVTAGGGAACGATEVVLVTVVWGCCAGACVVVVWVELEELDDDWLVVVSVVAFEGELRWWCEPPKNVVRPWDATEPPNTSSGSVSTATAMANAIAAVMTAILRRSPRGRGCR